MSISELIKVEGPFLNQVSALNPVKPASPDEAPQVVWTPDTSQQQGRTFV